MASVFDWIILETLIYYFQLCFCRAHIVLRSYNYKIVCIVVYYNRVFPLVFWVYIYVRMSVGLLIYEGVLIASV